MKILFDHPSPFLLAHGGFQTQIEQTRVALEAEGTCVEYLRWWDAGQAGDLIHYFGRPMPSYIQLAHQKRLPVVFTALHGGIGVRSEWKRTIQRIVISTAEHILPESFLDRLAWSSYRLADACITVTPYEGELVQRMFNAPREKVSFIPNGIEEVFSPGSKSTRSQWLVTTASILPVKRVVETAEAAVRAATPYWVVGRPFSETDSYFQRFRALCDAHPDILRYEGAIYDRTRLAQVYREARGFVLLSHWESLSISALEAAASGCPLLLSDLPWARIFFKTHAQYCRPTSIDAIAGALRDFYTAAPHLAPPPRPATWREVAQAHVSLYGRVLSTSR